MRKKLINMGLVLGLSTSLFGFTYEIKEGWQQLGAVENIDDVPKAFKDSCIDYLWYYKNNGPNPADGEWKLHIVNETDYNYDAYCGEKLTELKKGQGFWAKANTDCSINVGTASNCESDMPAPPDLDKPECISCDAGNNNSTGDTNTEGQIIPISWNGIINENSSGSYTVNDDSTITICRSSLVQFKQDVVLDSNNDLMVKISTINGNPYYYHGATNLDGTRVEQIDSACSVGNELLSIFNSTTNKLETYIFNTDTHISCALGIRNDFSNGNTFSIDNIGNGSGCGTHQIKFYSKPKNMSITEATEQINNL